MGWTCPTIEEVAAGVERSGKTSTGGSTDTKIVLCYQVFGASARLLRNTVFAIAIAVRSLV